MEIDLGFGGIRPRTLQTPTLYGSSVNNLNLVLRDSPKGQHESRIDPSCRVFSAPRHNGCRSTQFPRSKSHRDGRQGCRLVAFTAAARGSLISFEPAHARATHLAPVA